MPRLANALFQSQVVQEEQGVLLHLLTISVPAYGTSFPATTLYLADSNTDMVLQGQTYTAFPFQFSGGVTHSSDGSVDKAQLSCANPERILMPYINNYNNLKGTTVLVYTIYQSNLSVNPNGFITDYFVVDSYIANDTTLTLLLDPSVNFDRKLPKASYNNNSCRFRYKDPITCKYAGSLPSCNKTLQDCSNHTIPFFSTGTLNVGVDTNNNTVFWGPSFPIDTKPGYLLVINGITYTIQSANVSVTLINSTTVVINALVVAGTTSVSGTSGITYQILKGNQKNFGGFPGVPTTTRTLVL